MRKYFVIILLLLPLVLHAQEAAYRSTRGWFTYAPYGQSLYADQHPFFARLDIAALSNREVYDFGSTGKDYRCYSEGLFGMMLPIWHGDLGSERFGLSFTMAISADLWLDLFEHVTAPVVNTDYRISAPTTTFIHRLNRGFARNYSLAWTPFRHESTHIGDEQVIRRIDQGYALRRVNVSYNYTQLEFTLNEPEDRLSQCHTLRAGVLLLWNPKAGWYFISEEAGDGNPALGHPRMSPWEAWLQYQYQSPTARCGLQAIVSAEVRNRAVYGYDLSLKAGAAEQNVQTDYRRFTYNIFAGARYNIPDYDGYFSRVCFGIRAYHGNCPYGMLRAVDNFSQIGACLIFQ